MFKVEKVTVLMNSPGRGLNHSLESCHTVHKQMLHAGQIYLCCALSFYPPQISICNCFVLCEAKGSGQVFGHLDFKIVVEPADAPPFTIVLLAPSRQEKAAWTSDISQVISLSWRLHVLLTMP